MKKIIVASDSFKGSVSSAEVARSVAVGVRRVLPDCEVIEIPVADGGEGTIDALVSAMHGERITCVVHDPLMRLVRATYGILADGETAVVEMALASGLTLVSAAERNPMLTSTFGTGELIKDALMRGCVRFLVGIGGSATNDAGTGMLQALGFRFLDAEGAELGVGGQVLGQIRSVDDSQVMPEVRNASFTIACDVTNPFSGPNGASFVYARQKGADDEMIHLLDDGLKSFASVIKKSRQKEIDCMPGAGAAGGLGGGFVAFLQAELKPGIQMVLDVLHFDERIRNADLIITGEGKMDRQTRMGKTPTGVLQAAKKQQIPVIAIGGAIEDSEDLNEQGFLSVMSIQPAPVSLEQAMDREFTLRNIERTVEQVIRIRI